MDISEKEELWARLRPLEEQGRGLLLTEDIPSYILQEISQEIHSTGMEEDWRQVAAFLGHLSSKHINFIEYLSAGVLRKEAMLVTFDLVKGADLSKLLTSLEKAGLYNLLGFIYDKFYNCLLEVIQQRSLVVNERSTVNDSRILSEAQGVVSQETLVNKTAQLNTLDSGFDSLSGAISSEPLQPVENRNGNGVNNENEINGGLRNREEFPKGFVVSTEEDLKLKSSRDTFQSIIASEKRDLPAGLISREPRSLGRIQRQNDASSFYIPDVTVAAILCDSTPYALVQALSDKPHGGDGSKPSSQTPDESPRQGENPENKIKGAENREQDPPHPLTSLKQDVMIVFVVFHSDARTTAYELIDRLESRGILSLTVEHLQFSGLLNIDWSLLIKYLTEVSYIIPVLSRGYLTEIQSRSHNNDPRGSINKYVYQHCLAEYSQTCVNFRWMPVMSTELVSSTTVKHRLRTSCHVLRNYFLLWERFEELVKVLRFARKWQQA